MIMSTGVWAWRRPMPMWWSLPLWRRVTLPQVSTWSWRIRCWVLGLVVGVGCLGFCVGGLVDSRCGCWLVSSLELDGCKHAKRGVASLTVVEDLEVFEDRVG